MLEGCSLQGEDPLFNGDPEAESVSYKPLHKAMVASHNTSSPFPPPARWCVVLVFSIALFSYGALALLPPFATRGEAREAVVVLNMFEQENFILPKRNGTVYPSKPPLFHWLSALSATLTGTLDEFSIRFPSVFAGAILLSIFFRIGASLLGVHIAALGTLMLGTSPEYVQSASVARVDMVFTAAQGIGLLFVFLWSERVRGVFPRGLFGGTTVAFALAVLTKGPAGLVLPWAVFAVYIAVRFSLRELLQDHELRNRLIVLPAISALLSLAVAGVWYLLAYWIGGREFLDIHFMRENVARVIGMRGYNTGHAAPFYATPLLLLTGTLPWSVLLLPGGVVFLPELRRSIRESEEIRSRFFLYSMISVAVFVAFFSLTASKRSVYLLPCYPAFVVLILSLFTQALERGSGGHRARWLAIGFLLLSMMLLVVSFVVLVVPPWLELLIAPIRPLHAQREVIALAVSNAQSSRWIPGGVALSIIFSSIAIWALSRSESRRSVVALGGAVLCLIVTVGLGFFPPIARFHSPKLFITQVLQVLPEGNPLFSFRDEFYPAIFYGRRPIYDIREISEINERCAELGARCLERSTDANTVYVLLRESYLPLLDQAGISPVVLARSENRAALGKDRMVFVRAVLRRESGF